MMTCDRWMRSPEEAEENFFRPHFRHVESLQVDVLDEFEGFEECMTSWIFLNVDDVNAHRHDVRLDLIAGDAGADAPHGERSARPRHRTTAWLLADDDVSVFSMICQDTIFKWLNALLVALSRAFRLLFHRGERRFERQSQVILGDDVSRFSRSSR